MPKKCSVEGCNRDAKERGWCHGHYQRWYQRGDLTPERPLGRKTEGICATDGCERTIYARGLCSPHYRRLMQHGHQKAEQPLRPPAGERHIHHGYYVVAVPLEMRHLTNGETSCLEHRYVMAQMLGRPLFDDESVHHRNGNRLDNRPQNLELWSRWQPRGQRTADKVDWALELLARYAPDRLVKLE
jgi:HNH endonuclease